MAQLSVDPASRADEPLLPSLPPIAPQALRKAPLKTMLGQLRFPQQRELTDEAVVASLQRRFEDKYPRLLRETQVTLSVGGSNVQAQQAIVWRLTDIERSWSLLVGADSLSLETTAYTIWTEFERRFAEAIAAVETVAHIRVRERVGLRYVNEIRDGVNTAPDWRSKISPAFLGILSDPAFDSAHLAHSLAEARFEESAAIVVVRYGPVHQAGPGVRVPFFLLDIDCSNETPASFESTETMRLFSTFNDSIWRIFRRTLTDSFYEELKVAS